MRALFCVAALTACPAVALANQGPVVLSHLGDAPLTAPLHSKRDVQRNAGRLGLAAHVAGLNHSDALAVRQAIDRGAFQHVAALPRSLDTMTWGGATIRKLDRVRIPANQPGWVIRLAGRTVWIPEACGNLSVVANPRPVAHVVPPSVVCSAGCYTVASVPPPTSSPGFVPPVPVEVAGPVVPAPVSPPPAPGHRFAPVGWIVGAIGALWAATDFGGGPHSSGTCPPR